MSTAHPSVKTYVVVFVLLLALLVATVGVAYVPLGPRNVAVALAFAFAKAVLVVLFFMHVRYSSHLTWLTVGAALLWLGILLALTMADYDTHGWMQ